MKAVVRKEVSCEKNGNVALIFLAFAVALIIQGCAVAPRFISKPEGKKPVGQNPKILPPSNNAIPQPPKSVETEPANCDSELTNEEKPVENQEEFQTSPESSFQQTGFASYYGNKFQGRKTASGERYNKNLMTAAHQTLPFNTKVRVTCLDNNLSVIVRINDRGPRSQTRIIDLSRAAANEIDIVRKGIAKVSIEVVE